MNDIFYFTAADRPYVVDVHIPADYVDLSPTYSGDRVVSPVGASGLQRSQTPIKASPVSSRDGHSGKLVIVCESAVHKMSKFRGVEKSNKSKYFDGIVPSILDSIGTLQSCD